MVALDRRKYDDARDAIYRYLELCPRDNAEKIRGAIVVANRSIMDIDSQLEAFDTNDPRLSVFYQLLIKVDCLIGAVEYLYKELLCSDKGKGAVRKWLDGEWGTDLRSIRRFRMIRSLAIAHPLETDRYPDFGVDKDDGVWCEDVLPRNSMIGDDGDYVLAMLRPGSAVDERLPVTIEDDFSVPANCALDALGRLGEAISCKSRAKIAELSKTPLRAHAEMPLPDYLDALKKDLEDRYPSKVERINYEDGFDRGYSIIDKAEQLLRVSFSDKCVEAAYAGYRSFVLEALYEFADSLQKMDLEGERFRGDGVEAAPNAEDRLGSAIYPSCSEFVFLCEIDGASYCFEKILGYLDSSEGRSVESARCKLVSLGYPGCTQGDACSNAEWGIIQLLKVVDVIRLFFPLTLDASDVELYCQVCAAAYYSTSEDRNGLEREE